VGTVSIVIPVYNESKTILNILSRVQSLDFGSHELEIIVVDGASTDGTSDLLRAVSDPRLHVIYEEARRGKGVAVAEGYRASHGDAVIIQDADDEYDPADIPSIVAPVLEGTAAAVYGSRFLGHIEGMTAPRRFANRFLTTVMNVLYGSHLTDACTCYKAVKGDVARSLDLETPTFSVCMEITAKVLRSGRAVREVPIRYRARTDDDVKSDWRSLPQAFCAAIKFRFKRLDSRVQPLLENPREV
jgi:dolichol-phosphate hexosyltransferase